MSVILVMLPIALILAGFFVFLFVRSVMGGQYDDLDTPAMRVALDDDAVMPEDQDASA
ncbi:MAG: cbb3-type cytochrome oxidase assembly protein CcoS [Planctomycetota bacterium]